MDPLKLFEKWFTQEKENNNLELPAACCLSTLGLDGYPNARFVSLKEISNEAFVVTGPLNSSKGREIDNCSKVSLTFWWTATGRQVRVQGDVTKISESNAEIYFEQRNRDAKIVSTAFDQGKEIRHIEHLHKHFEEQKEKLGNMEIKRPEHWGGIYIKPIRIEFMEFKKSRLHERTLYQNVQNQWKMKLLQP